MSTAWAWTPCVPGRAWLVSRVRSGEPISASMTWVFPSGWCTVVSMVPGSPLVPSSRNQRAPYRAIRARWARVSTFWTRVGAPPRPRSDTRGGTNVGSAGPPPSRLTRADSWPARNRGGASVTVTASQSIPAAWLLGQGSHDLAAGPRVQVQVGVGGADRLRGQLDAVQHQVRRDPQEQGVLAAGGLALRAIGHDHRAAAGLGHDAQLALRGERRAAAAGQAGRLHALYQEAAPAPIGRAAVPVQGARAGLQAPRGPAAAGGAARPGRARRWRSWRARKARSWSSLGDPLAWVL